MSVGNRRENVVKWKTAGLGLYSENNYVPEINVRSRRCSLKKDGA